MYEADKSLEDLTVLRNNCLLFLNTSMGGGRKDINFHVNFHLIRRTHSFLNSLSELGFEQYPSYPHSNEKAKAGQQRAGLIYFGMQLFQANLFFS